MIINHADCGMLTFKDDELEAKLEKQTGSAAIVPARFYFFIHLEEDTRQQVQKMKSHPWILKNIPMRGFIYDVSTGRLTEVAPRVTAAELRS